MVARSMITICLILGLMVVGPACPRRETPPDEPPPVVPPGEGVDDSADTRVATGLFGLAHVLVKADENDPSLCVYKNKSLESEAWRANPHIWLVVSSCTGYTEVELRGFTRDGTPDDPFGSSPPHRVSFSGRRAIPLRLDVRPDAELGTYIYEVVVNGVATDPEIVIRDPDT